MWDLSHRFVGYGHTAAALDARDRSIADSCELKAGDPHDALGV